MPKEIDIHKIEFAPEESESPTRPARRPAPPPAEKKSSAGWLVGVALIAVIIGCAFYFLQPKHALVDDKNKKREIPVTIATAGTETVPIEIRSIGNVQSYSVVNVVPQVGGQLMRVCFTQGQMVRKGDLLFQIDATQYEAALEQAKGNVAKDMAQVKAAGANVSKDLAQVGQLEAMLNKDQASAGYAYVQMTRYADLVKQGAVSHEQSDQTRTNSATAEAAIDADRKAIENAKSVVDADRAQVETAKGTLQADRAAMHNAQIQLGWTQIRSPIDGRTGSLNVYQGNVVAANNATPLVAISEIHPIYISFTVPESYLDHIRRCLTAKTLDVEALVGGTKKHSVKGTVSFLENTVNTTSGTIVLRATFPNTDNNLYPGQFVDVVASMPPDGISVVIPASAVQPSQSGSSVYVVGPDKKVKLVPVELARTHGNMAAIAKGISPGDTVVTDGQLQLVPGATVKVVDENGSPITKHE